MYASSSSVYGGIKNCPSAKLILWQSCKFILLKKANELMANSYSHLYNIPSTGLRFFTVYGPWGSDMAPMIFANAFCIKRNNF